MTEHTNILTRFIHILLPAVVSLMLCGCVTNDGDIGFWYGTWAFEKITVDGVETDDWKTDDTWSNVSFQNNIAAFALVDADGSYEQRWCTWTADDNNHIVAFDFTHSDNQTAPGTGKYAAPAWLYFEPGVTKITYHLTNNKSMRWTNTLSDGRRIEYQLRKEY